MLEQSMNQICRCYCIMNKKLNINSSRSFRTLLLMGVVLTIISASFCQIRIHKLSKRTYRLGDISITIVPLALPNKQERKERRWGGTKLVCASWLRRDPLKQFSTLNMSLWGIRNASCKIFESISLQLERKSSWINCKSGTSANILSFNQME